MGERERLWRRLGDVGAQLANVAYNLGQDSSTFDEQMRPGLAKLARQWDAARSALGPHATADAAVDERPSKRAMRRVARRLRGEAVDTDDPFAADAERRADEEGARWWRQQGADARAVAAFLMKEARHG